MEGGCFCGAIRYRIDGNPRRVAHCHCLHCRRTSGAPFVTWIDVSPERFRYLRGRPGNYESRPRVTREFCGDCGTQLTYRNAEEPDSIDVTACSLDDPGGLRPQDHVWNDRRLPWVRIDDGLPCYGRGRNDA